MFTTPCKTGYKVPIVVIPRGICRRLAWELSDGFGMESRFENIPIRPIGFDQTSVISRALPQAQHPFSAAEVAMQEIKCPKGCGVLQRRQTSKGMMWECDQCHGRSVGIAVLKKFVAPKLISSLWELARKGEFSLGAVCMHCNQRMAHVSLPLETLNPPEHPPSQEASSEQTVASLPSEPEVAEPKLELDVCQRCFLLWVETSQLAHLPKPPPERPDPLAEKELPPEAKKLLALQLANREARRIHAEYSDQGRYGYFAADGLLSVLFDGF